MYYGFFSAYGICGNKNKEMELCISDSCWQWGKLYKEESIWWTKGDTTIDNEMLSWYLFFWNIMWSNILVVKHVAFALNKESRESQPYFAHHFTWREK